MNFRILPNDVARCSGAKSVDGKTEDECVFCLRRTSPSVGERFVMMAPPKKDGEPCEYRIT